MMTVNYIIRKNTHYVYILFVFITGYIKRHKGYWNIHLKKK